MIRNEEAQMIGSFDQYEQITVINDTGAELVNNEVFFKTNANGDKIPHVARATIANGARGEAMKRGRFSFAANPASVFEADDPIWWNHNDNKAYSQATAKAGMSLLAVCTLAKASGALFVEGDLPCIGATTPVAPVTSASSSSTSSASTSSNSDSSASSDSSVSSSTSIASISSNSDSSDSSASVSA